MATLLTGVGYIGATLLRRLLERGNAAPIVAMDNFFSTSREQVLAALAPGVRLIEGDVADPSAVDRAFAAVDGDDVVVYHLAAQPSAGIADSDPQTTERSNLIGARVVLEAARARAARVVFGGSFRVYGDELTSGQTVDERTPYGRVGDLSHLSKIYVEQLARMIGGRFVSVRLGVTYGLSPVMKTTRSFMTVPNLFCARAARGEVLHVLEDRPVGFIHVSDAADALVLAGDRLAGRGQDWEVVNAAPEVATIGQVARHVQRLARDRGISARIEGDAASEASFMVRSRLEEDGFAASRSLGEGLGEVLDHFLDRG